VAGGRAVNAAGTLTAVLNYAARGWPTFPLHPPDNTPLTAHGFHDASTDTDQIRQWWQRWPDANIGLRCGDAFDVLDIDHDDFVTGVADLPDCETDGGPVVVTGSGRFHLYFTPSGLGRRIKFSRWCDWLGTGGYVVAPPSTHRCGGTYTWHSPPDLPLTPAPALLLAAVEPPPAPRRPAPAIASPQRRGGWSCAGLVARVATAGEGQRNDALNWAASKVGADVRAGKAAEAAALAALEQLAVAAERSGLGAREVDATIRSGYNAGRDGRAA